MAKDDDFSFEQKLMLEEYKKAQDSAEHNDNMAWLMSTILVVAAISLFGLILTSGCKSNLFLLLIGCIVGFLLILVNIIIFYNARSYKLLKYSICKKIEGKFNDFLREKDINYQLENHLKSANVGGYGMIIYFMLLAIIAFAFLVVAIFLVSFR